MKKGKDRRMRRRVQPILPIFECSSCFLSHVQWQEHDACLTLDDDEIEMKKLHVYTQFSKSFRVYLCMYILHISLMGSKESSKVYFYC